MNTNDLIATAVEPMLKEIRANAETDAEKATGLERDLHTFVLTIASWGMDVKDIAALALTSFDIEFSRGY